MALLPIIWNLFGIGCVIAASNKNRSVIIWFLLGMLLGPFGLLYILLLNPKEKGSSARYIEKPWETTLRLKKEGKWDGRPLKKPDE
jgi:hypothetical protein